MLGWLLRLMLAGLITAAVFPQVPTIRVAANLVLTPVWVADAEGNAIRDLQLRDFEIQENGVRVAGERLGASGEAPLEIALLFDLSGSVYARFDIERQAAARFLSRIMRPDDTVSIISVANEPRILLERTSSLKVALKAVARIAPTTQATALYTSIARAAQMLRRVDRADIRRVVVALSDGEDNRSIGTRQSDVLRELQLADCLFYSINPNGYAYAMSYLSRRAQENMEALAQQTGGAAFVTDDVRDLAAFYDRIADELQGQYLLGYYSPSTSGPSIYRRIRIAVRGRPDLQVKTRSGYYPK